VTWNTSDGSPQTCRPVMTLRHTNARRAYTLLCRKIKLSYRFLSKNTTMKMCEFIILPLVLCGCEAWPLTLREEHKLRMFENRVLRRTFGLEREEVAGGWRRLHNEGLHKLCVSSNVMRVVKSSEKRWEWHVARMGEMRNA